MGATPTTSSRQRQALDDTVLAYVEWREECAAVWKSYVCWRGATAEEARRAHAGYLAALDREEAAAGAYAKRLEHVRDLLETLKCASTDDQ
jgi:hypothetical protein